MEHMADGVRVRPMRPADYEPAWQAVLAGGWGDRRLTLGFYLRYTMADLFVAEAADGAIVGTASAVRHAETGWIGLVFVAPALRGQGLGRRLTVAALERLQALGCRSILLAASALGRPIYERLGFGACGGYTVLRRASADLAVPSQPDVRRLHTADLEAVNRLDQQASGEDRHVAIETLGLADGQGWVLGRPGTVRGFALRTPWGLGPAVATDSVDGQRLLDVLLHQPWTAAQVSVTVPTENALARAHLTSRGFAEGDTLPRMVLGEPVPWRPETLWAIFNFAMG
jgi:GNAT superfamily N-acetyltransferase